VSAWTGDAAGKQFIEDQFEQGNIVYGVWLDATKPHGIDYEVLKSSERLESLHLGNRGAVRDPGSSNSLSLDVFQRIIAVKIVTQIAIQHVGTGVMRWYEHAAAFAKKQTKPGFCRTARDGRRTAAIRHLIAPRFGLSPRRRRSWSRSRRPPCATSGHCLITPAALLVTSPNLWKRVIWKP
jgi:hypothetical protein